MKIEAPEIRCEVESKEDIVANVSFLLSFVSSDIDLNFDVEKFTIKNSPRSRLSSHRIEIRGVLMLVN